MTSRKYYIRVRNIGVESIEFIYNSNWTIVGTGGKDCKIKTLRDTKGCINYLEKNGYKYEEWDESRLIEYMNPEKL
jgi:hypothetical protein